MEDALYSALAVLVDTDGTTIRDIPKLFNDPVYRTKLLAHATDTVALEYWQDDYARLSERNQIEVARPIMHRIRTFYRNPVIERIVVQPVSLDFRAMMDEGKMKHYKCQTCGKFKPQNEFYRSKSGRASVIISPDKGAFPLPLAPFIANNSKYCSFSSFGLKAQKNFV